VGPCGPGGNLSRRARYHGTSRRAFTGLERWRRRAAGQHAAGPRCNFVLLSRTRPRERKPSRPFSGRPRSPTLAALPIRGGQVNRLAQQGPGLGPLGWHAAVRRTGALLLSQRGPAPGAGGRRPGPREGRRPWRRPGV